MRIVTMTLLGLIGVMIGVSVCVADPVVVTIDPVSSYQLLEYPREVCLIPLGATFSGVGNMEECKLIVENLPASFSINNEVVSRNRIAISLLGRAVSRSSGDYYVRIIAVHFPTNTRSIATMKIKVVSGDSVNAPIIFDPLEQVKNIQVGTWYSMAISATDLNNDKFAVGVEGATGNALGYANFTQSSNGRPGGVLWLKMNRPGILKLMVKINDLRESAIRNTAVAELQYVVQ
ncbi:MAG: hypothetical protein HZC15_05480 [Candidatus Omnitrophica bacterium]|nr:hypothetical protein [Candidatus Omnitrophota bacterium]